MKAFKPAIVYPYHYGDSDVEKFKELVGAARMCVCCMR